MSSKLLGCLQYRLGKVISQDLRIVWEDTLFRIHVVFYGNEFLNESERDVVIKNAREILIHNRKNNPEYWCTCLPYELRREKHCTSTLYMDYVILLTAKPGDFQENGIDLLPDRQLCYENNYFEGLELVSDSASSSDESE